MLEQLFGSKTRVKVMKVFLENPEKRFFVRELTRLTDSLINSVRRELDNLKAVGFIVIDETGAIKKVEQKIDSETGLPVKKGLNAKKYFRLNRNNVYCNELNALFSKGQWMVEKKFTDRLLKTGSIRYLGMGGFFIDDSKAKTDMLIIGKMDKEKIQKIIAEFEMSIKQEIRYTMMDLQEYKLRKDIADRFLRDIIENEENIVILNDLKIIEDL